MFKILWKNCQTKRTTPMNGAVSDQTFQTRYMCSSQIRVHYHSMPNLVCAVFAHRFFWHMNTPPHGSQGQCVHTRKWTHCLRKWFCNGTCKVGDVCGFRIEPTSYLPLHVLATTSTIPIWNWRCDKVSFRVPRFLVMCLCISHMFKMDRSKTK